MRFAHCDCDHTYEKSDNREKMIKSCGHSDAYTERCDDMFPQRGTW